MPSHQKRSSALRARSSKPTSCDGSSACTGATSADRIFSHREGNHRMENANDASSNATDPYAADGVTDASEAHLNDDPLYAGDQQFGEAEDSNGGGKNVLAAVGGIVALIVCVIVIAVCCTKKTDDSNATMNAPTDSLTTPIGRSSVSTGSRSTSNACVAIAVGISVGAVALVALIWGIACCTCCASTYCDSSDSKNSSSTTTGGSTTTTTGGSAGNTTITLTCESATSKFTIGGKYPLKCDEGLKSGVSKTNCWYGKAPTSGNMPQCSPNTCCKDGKGQMMVADTSGSGGATIKNYVTPDKCNNASFITTNCGGVCQPENATGRCKYEDRMSPGFSCSQVNNGTITPSVPVVYCGKDSSSKYNTPCYIGTQDVPSSNTLSMCSSDVCCVL